ncbi:hypothetical protein B0H11DRAFT_2396149 [Mycena galericulata]|nr:hypothetical protein B0H11DRAFT_2396149 [Mycena galericulata]
MYHPQTDNKSTEIMHDCAAGLLPKQAFRSEPRGLRSGRVSAPSDAQRFRALITLLKMHKQAPNVSERDCRATATIFSVQKTNRPAASRNPSLGAHHFVWDRTYAALCHSDVHRKHSYPVYTPYAYHTYAQNSGGTQPTANHSHIHPPPSSLTALPGTGPQSGRQRCADLYREHPERIKNVVQKAKDHAAESRGPIKLSTEHGALWRHLLDRHGILDGKRVPCCWTGCSATLKSNSLVQHLKSAHFKLRLKCPSCPTTFRREDTLKRHLSGERWVPEQN